MDSKYVGSALLVLAGAFAHPAFASAYIPCDGCSDSQMQTVALAHGVGRFVVGNVLGNSAEAFRVYLGTHANVTGVSAATSRLYIDYDSLTSQESVAFAAYVRFYHAIPMGYQKQYDLRIVPPGSPVGVPNTATAMLSRVSTQLGVKPMSQPAGGGTVAYPTPGVNAYTVVNGGPDQNQFDTWLSTLANFNIASTVTDGMTTLSEFHITDVSQQPGISFTVTFTDGSHIGAYVDTKQQPPQITVNPNTAVDSHGNTIPASYAAVAGAGRQNYGFGGGGNSTDRSNMGRQIGGFGVDMPGTNRFACVSTVDENNRPMVHCVPY